MDIIYILIAVVSGMVLGPIMFLAGFKTAAIMSIAKQADATPPVVANLKGVMLDSHNNPFHKVEVK